MNTPTTLKDVAQVFLKHYREELWRALKAALAVVASLSLRKRKHCLPLIFEGPPSSGKTVVVDMLEPDRPATEERLFKLSKFTPRAFVSHSADKTKKQLKDIDLLPKLKDKVMVNKELALIFRGKEADLKENFSTLIDVLDGRGYWSSTGAQGLRGYTGKYFFNWLGATTPIPEDTHKLMAQLGPRLLFYEILEDKCSVDELIDFVESYENSDAPDECQGIVNDFVESHFQRYPLDSVNPKDIKIPQDLLRAISQYAQLISCGRVEVELFKPPKTPEGPRRTLLLLIMVAKGLALIEGLSTVTWDHVDAIRHIAFSCIPENRRKILHALLAAGSSLTTPEATKCLRASKPTALDYMRVLAATGIVSLTEGDQKTSTPAEITLAEDWKWLRSVPPLRQVVAGGQKP